MTSAGRACASHRWWDHKAPIKIQSSAFVTVANTPTDATRTPKLALRGVSLESANTISHSERRVTLYIQL